MACEQCGLRKGHMDGCPNKEPSKGGGERGKKVPPPENTLKHSHDYRLSREYSELITDRNVQWRYYYKEFKCVTTRGKCERPIHIDFMRRVRVLWQR